MKRDCIRHRQVNLPSGNEQEMRLARMQKYVEVTRPAFEEAIRRRKLQGVEVNGLLADPACRKRINDV